MAWQMTRSLWHMAYGQETQERMAYSLWLKSPRAYGL